jgi:hypothetical protein
MLIKSTHRPTQLSTPTPATASEASQPEQAATPQLPQDSLDTSRTAQAQRISAYVEEKKLDAAKTMKSVSGLMAGQLTGMTIGSMIFAPLALKMGNLYIATGGAALTGAAMAFGASKLAEMDLSKVTNNKAGDTLGVVGAVANSLPKIAYPTMVGVTAAQKEVFYSALDRLPLGGVTSAPTIDIVKGLEDVGASGLATPLFSHNRIFLDVDQMNISNSWAQEVVTHEVGHTYDFSKGVGPILSRNFRGGGFGKEPFISDYANTNRMEDYAESYAKYHLEPERLQSVAPEKYAALDKSQAPGLVDKALDRPSVRETGRKIGTAFEAAPRARNLLALGASLVGPFQLYRGAASYEKGVKDNDPLSRLNGKMNLASGAALMGPGTAPLSLLVSAGQIATNIQLNNGSISLDQAEKRADAALTIATGPFGSIASSIQGELDSAGLLVDTTKANATASFAPFGAKQSIGKVAVGFALGAAAGGVLSPFLHAGSAHATVFSAAAGSWAGGMLGAAAGFGLHMMTKPEVPSFLLGEQQQTKLTGDDKKLLAKLSAPAVVGGAAGAVGGYFGGQMIGQAIGQSLAGAAGGVTGAALGSYLGVLGGSYAAAKGGAKLGANWAGLQAKGEPPAQGPKNPDVNESAA